MSELSRVHMTSFCYATNEYCSVSGILPGKKKQATGLSADASDTLVKLVVNEDYETPILNLNCGDGAFCKRLLNVGCQSVIGVEAGSRESSSDPSALIYRQSLEELEASYPRRFIWRDCNYGTFKLDAIYNNTHQLHISSGLTSVPWKSDSIPLRVFRKPSKVRKMRFADDSTIIELAYHLAKRTFLFQFGRVQWNIIISDYTANRLRVQPGHKHYSYVTILLGALFHLDFAATLKRRDFSPLLKNSSEIRNFHDNRQVTFLRLTPRKDIEFLCGVKFGVERFGFHFFIQQLFMTRNRRVLTVLDKWIPGLRKTFNSATKASKSDTSSGYSGGNRLIKDVGINDFVTLYRLFSKHPHFQSSNFYIGLRHRYGDQFHPSDLDEWL